MTEKPSQSPTAQAGAAPGVTGQIALSQAEILSPLPQNPIAEVVETWYANYAFVTNGSRDIWIDFLQVPGAPREGRTVIPTLRVFLTPVAAEKLAEAILGNLKNAVKTGALEKLSV